MSTYKLDDFNFVDPNHIAHLRLVVNKPLIDLYSHSFDFPVPTAQHPSIVVKYSTKLSGFDPHVLKLVQDIYATQANLLVARGFTEGVREHFKFEDYFVALFRYTSKEAFEREISLERQVKILYDFLQALSPLFCSLQGGSFSEILFTELRTIVARQIELGGRSENTRTPGVGSFLGTVPYVLIDWLASVDPKLIEEGFRESVPSGAVVFSLPPNIRDEEEVVFTKEELLEHVVVHELTESWIDPLM